jgi:hypothetical protein
MNLAHLSDEALLSSAHAKLRHLRELDADLLVLLGEIQERELFLGRGFPSMWKFCAEELGFSEDETYSRLAVARLLREHPLALDYARSGKVHLTGLRLLAPILNSENAAEVLEEASGKSRRLIEELIARRCPKPPVPTSIRKLPERPAPVAALAPPEPMPLPPPPPSRPTVEPLSAESFSLRFTATRAMKDKLKQAQDLLRHRVPDGDLSTILERALDLLIADVEKERFGSGAGPRTSAADVHPTVGSRHIPAAIRREVYERDGGQCTFLSEDGRRCSETGRLEFDHLEGFARTGEHSVTTLAIRCTAHNQHAAKQMYGRAFMERARTRSETGRAASTMHLLL